MASSSDGVHEMLVAAVCVAIVVSAREPNFARSVCKNALDAGVSVIVVALPSVTAGMLGVVTRGIAGSDMTTLPFAVPMDVEYVQFAVNANVI